MAIADLERGRTENTLTLTQEQRTAVEWGEGPLMVLAGAGTGKTTVVVERVRHLLATDPELEPENILVLTYNVRAAGELLDRFEETLGLVDGGSRYALTGSIIATDRKAVADATNGLRFAAGNFYINDKPTGAVVGQQPFGGGRASGTNDKAGAAVNLLRWTSPRSIKETFVPPKDYRYPYMDTE